MIRLILKYLRKRRALVYRFADCLKQQRSEYNGR